MATLGSFLLGQGDEGVCPLHESIASWSLATWVGGTGCIQFWRIGDVLTIRGVLRATIHGIEASFSTPFPITSLISAVLPLTLVLLGVGLIATSLLLLLWLLLLPRLLVPSPLTFVNTPLATPILAAMLVALALVLWRLARALPLCLVGGFVVSVCHNVGVGSWLRFVSVHVLLYKAGIIDFLQCGKTLLLIRLCPVLKRLSKAISEQVAALLLVNTTCLLA